MKVLHKRNLKSAKTMVGTNLFLKNSLSDNSTEISK